MAWGLRLSVSFGLRLGLRLGKNLGKYCSHLRCHAMHLPEARLTRGLRNARMGCQCARLRPSTRGGVAQQVSDGLTAAEEPKVLIRLGQRRG